MEHNSRVVRHSGCKVQCSPMNSSWASCINPAKEEFLPKQVRPFRQYL
jgi:hypothetical protein